MEAVIPQELRRRACTVQLIPGVELLQQRDAGICQADQRVNARGVQDVFAI